MTRIDYNEVISKMGMLQLLSSGHLYRIVLLLFGAGVVLLPGVLPGDSEDTLTDHAVKAVRDADLLQIRETTRELAALGTSGAVRTLGDLASNTRREDILLLIIEALSICTHEESFSTLARLERRSTTQTEPLRQALFEALLARVDRTTIREECLKSSRPLLRRVAYQVLSETPETLDDELSERIDRERHAEALPGLASYLGACLNAKLIAVKAKKKLKSLLNNSSSGDIHYALARTGGSEIFDLLQKEGFHADWRVRLEMYRLAGRHKSREAGLFLVAMLRREKGRLRGDIADLLGQMTGQNHGLNPTDWRNAIVGGAQRIWGEEVKSSNSNKYYGIDVVSKRVVFILDKTGSMRAASRGGEGAEKTTRIQVAKDKLCALLRSLDAEERKKAQREYRRIPPEDLTHFTIVTFSNQVLWWERTMIQATSENIERACEWIQQIQPSGPTHSILPLREVFEFAQRALQDSQGTGLSPEKEVDTIFFVTDGLPNGPRPNVVPTPLPVTFYADQIISLTRNVVKDLEIVIHCIGIRVASGRDFLGNLAQVTGGKAVFVDD